MGDYHRRDRKTGEYSRIYFMADYLGYIVGLVITVAVMHVFKAAQPALLYLVPTCLLFPLVVALARGEVAMLFKYDEGDPEPVPAKTPARRSGRKSAKSD